MMKYAFTLILFFVLTGCGRVECRNEIQQELVSPDARKKIVLFSRNCGATTGFNLQASILEKSDQLPDEGGNGFVLDGGSATVSWKNDAAVLVVIEPGARIFKQKSSVGGVDIKYDE